MLSWTVKSKLEEHNKTKNHLLKFNNKSDNMPLAEYETKKDLNEEYKNELKQRLQQEYEDELEKELELKENEYKQNITKLKNKVEDLSFNFDDAIQFDNIEVVKELKPISNEIITYKKLNKINLNDILTNYSKLLTINELLFIINYNINTSTTLYIDKFWNNIEEENWIYLQSPRCCRGLLEPIKF